MSDQSNFERLKTTPVTELNLGSASIRRVIKHAGFDTLPKLLDLSEKDIDALFEWRDADVIIELRERYRANPEEFASSVLQRREIDAEAVDKTLSKAKASYGCSAEIQRFERRQFIIRARWAHLVAFDAIF